MTTKTIDSKVVVDSEEGLGGSWHNRPFCLISPPSCPIGMLIIRHLVPLECVGRSLKKQ